MMMRSDDHHRRPAIVPGFRFAPTDRELILYLKHRVGCCADFSPPPLFGEVEGLIVDFDIYCCDPWELPRNLFRHDRSVQKEMYFFTPTHPSAAAAASGRKGIGGGRDCRRCSRTAGCGVWHGNGKDNHIRKRDSCTGKPTVIGHSTSFKFEKIIEDGGRVKTEWLMHEYRLQCHHNHGGLVLSKIYQKPQAKGADEEDDDQVDYWLQQQRTEEEAASDPCCSSHISLPFDAEFAPDDILCIDDLGSFPPLPSEVADVHGPMGTGVDRFPDYVDPEYDLSLITEKLLSGEQSGYVPLLQDIFPSGFFSRRVGDFGV